MNSSALAAIETSVTAAVSGVSGLTSATAVPHMDDLFIPGDQEDQWLARPPVSYPGANICLNRDEIKIADSFQSSGYARIIYVVPVYILIVATSSGASESDARTLAFQITEACHRALIQFTPTGFPANTGAFGPLKPDGLHTYPIDATTHSTLTRWLVHFQLAA